MLMRNTHGLISQTNFPSIYLFVLEFAVNTAIPTTPTTTCMYCNHQGETQNVPWQQQSGAFTAVTASVHIFLLSGFSDAGLGAGRGGLQRRSLHVRLSQLSPQSGPVRRLPEYIPRELHVSEQPVMFLLLVSMVPDPLCWPSLSKTKCFLQKHILFVWAGASFMDYLSLFCFSRVLHEKMCILSMRYCIYFCKA